MISQETEIIMLWSFIVSLVFMICIYAYEEYKEDKHRKKLEDQRYKEHKEIIDLIYFVKNELLTRHID